MKVRQKSQKATRLIRLALFNGRTKGISPSFPINLYAPAHTGYMATSVTRVTYLMRLWGPFPMGDGDIQYEDSLSSHSP